MLWRVPLASRSLVKVSIITRGAGCARFGFGDGPTDRSTGVPVVPFSSQCLHGPIHRCREPIDTWKEKVQIGEPPQIAWSEEQDFIRPQATLQAERAHVRYDPAFFQKGRSSYHSTWGNAISTHGDGKVALPFHSGLLNPLYAVGENVCEDVDGVYANPFGSVNL